MEDHMKDEIEREVPQMVSILKMFNDPEPLLHDLLEHICQMFQDSGEMYNTKNVTLSCPCHLGAHQVDMEEFLLLEQAEGMLGTSLQTLSDLDYVAFNENNYSTDFYHNSFINALNDRIVRQKAPLRSMNIYKAILLADIGITATILKDTPKWSIIQILLQRDFGEEGWAWLADGLKRDCSIEMIFLSKEVIARAKRSDLRAVWEATPGPESVWCLVEHFQGPLPEDRDKWYEWEIEFSKMPSSMDDVIRGGLPREADEEARELHESWWMKLEQIWTEGQLRRDSD